MSFESQPTPQELESWLMTQARSIPPCGWNLLEREEDPSIFDASVQAKVKANFMEIKKRFDIPCIRSDSSFSDDGRESTYSDAFSSSGGNNSTDSESSKVLVATSLPSFRQQELQMLVDDPDDGYLSIIG